MLIRSQARTFNERRITLVIFPLLSLSPPLFIFTRVPSGPTWPFSTPFLRHRKKTTVSHTFPLVHDLAISTALLSFFPCPHAILRLIDTVDLFLRFAVSIVRLLQLLANKECTIKLLQSLLRACVPIYSFTCTSPVRNVRFFPTSRSLFNSSLQRYYVSADHCFIRFTASYRSASLQSREMSFQKRWLVYIM